MLKEISVEIIRRCPNNCLHCSSSSNKLCNECMPLEKFKEVITDASELGATTICLSGGEPFLHRELETMVQFVHEKGLKCYIYTSGIVFNGNCFASVPIDVMEKIKKWVTKLIFNLEAAEEKTYDVIMGTKGCFPKAIQSIINANNCNIITEIHFVPMKLNMAEIEDIVQLCEKLKVSKISFLRLVVHGRAIKNKDIIAPSDEDYTYIKHKINNLNLHSSLSVRIGVPLSDGNSCCKCEAAKGKLNIRYDGKVFPCEVFKNYDFKRSLPNLLPMDIYSTRLKTIYNQSDYLMCIRNLSNNYKNNNNTETCIGQELIDFETKEN